MRSGTGAYACTFTYDGPGNRLTQMQADGTLTTYTYNPASELLTSQVGEAVTTFSYDPVGNTVGEQTETSETNFTWDAENRLVEVDDGETVETSAYDATGLRRQKTAGGSTTHFVWDRVNLLAELDDTLARLAQYTDYPGVWGGLSSQRRGATSSYYAFDLSANTRALFNGGGITDRYLYEAFGVEQIVTGSTVNPLRFGGQVGYFRDLAERLYVRARHYTPAQARFVSRDPLDAGAADLCYGYARGNPVAVADPTGLAADWIGTCLLGAAGGAIAGGIISLLTGEGWCAAGCAALAGAVAGCCATAFCTHLPAACKVASCACGALGGLVGQLCSHGWDWDKMKSDPCSWAVTAVSALTGCFVGFWDPEEAKQKIVWFLLGIDIGAFGHLCGSV